MRAPMPGEESMSTQTKKKATRRNAQRRHADHRQTVEILSNVVADVQNAEQDGLLYCGSIRLANRRTPWLQITPTAMALWWPYPEAPHVVLIRDVPCKIPVRILEWSDDFVMIGYEGEPPAVAEWIDHLFRNVFNSKVGYSVDADLAELPPVSRA